MWKVPLFKIYHESKDIQQIKNVLERRSDWAIGEEINKFESIIAKYIGVKYAAVFNSGTSALHSILLAYGITKNCNVAVPSFTFISTANASLFVGAKPVFVDIEEKSLGMDPLHLKEIISKQKIDVIIPVHYSGEPCKIHEIVKIGKKNKIPVIEDAAEAFGAKKDKQKIGTFGDSAMFSFAQNKIITTGEGGAIVTNSKKIYEKLLLVRSHGRVDKIDYFTNANSSTYIELGYNFRMPTMMAALGIAQMKHLKKIIQLRKNIAKTYSKEFSQISDIITPNPKNNSEHVYQLYSIRIKNGRRNALMKHLKNKGIMSKIYFEPIHLTPFYIKNIKFKKDHLTITNKISEEILSLPIYPNMNKKEQRSIIKEVKRFFE